MGCDIHMYVEVQNTKTKEWKNTHLYRQHNEGGYSLIDLNIDRWYWTFGCLAGVRQHPNRPGFEPIAKARGLPHDVSQEIGALSNDWGADAHSHSWVLLSELQQAHTKHKLLEPDPDQRPFTDILDQVEKHINYVLPFSFQRPENADQVRLVFWFDN